MNLRRYGVLPSSFLGLLMGVMPSQAAPKHAYVVSSTASTVTIIDTATSAIKATVPVGSGPSRVAVSPDGSRAYVSHPSFGYVSVIDAAVLGVTSTITTGAGPGALAVAPDGGRLYVGTTAGVQVIDLPAGTAGATVPGTGSASEIVLTPDGSRAYVAAGVLSAIDTASLTATETAIPAASLAMMSNGQRLYAASGSSLSEVSTATNSVTRSIGVNGSVSALALTPDGSRLYAGVQGSNLVCSVYGCGGIAFRNVAVIETYGNTTIATIAIPAPVARMAVTPDRKDLYMTIPAASVSIASVNTNAIRLTIPVGSGVNGLAITSDPGAVIYPYVIDAVNDTAPATLVSNAGGTAVANVLVNDTLGGVRATLATVTLSQVSASNSGLSLNVATGAVSVEIGTPAGAHSLVYQICETTSPANCDQATVSVNVRLPYVIDAVDESAVSNTGKTAVNALLNDKLNALPATTANVRVTQVSSTHAGVTITASGFVNVAAGTPFGAHTLVYRICEAASLNNCDQATVSLEVIPYFVDAVNDAGATTRGGGIAVANVLANDKFGTGTASLANVQLSLVSSTSAGITLAANGAVSVAAGTALGGQTLVYRICEIGSPSNCDQATVSVTVNPYLIDAVYDSARASSKVANTALASVLWNDTLAGARATVANVRLSMVSLLPVSNKIRLDLTDGSVDVLGKTESGLYSLVYRICEIANPTNCDQATVSLDLTRSGGN